LSWIKAIFDAATLSADIREVYQKHRGEQATQREAQRASETYSTFSEEEVEAISTRLKACRDRFIAEGSGAQRARCMCSVFDDLMEGNGGVLPPIDDWERIYRQLCLGKPV
jgi:hypothetical protein